MCGGIGACVSDDSRVLSVKEGILVSIPSHLRGHIALYNLLELLRDNGYHMSAPSFAHLLSLAVRGVPAMKRASILEVRVGALESTLSSNHSLPWVLRVTTFVEESGV